MPRIVLIKWLEARGLPEDADITSLPIDYKPGLLVFLPEIKNQPS
jgi:hypothetical protein